MLKIRPGLCERRQACNCCCGIVQTLITIIRSVVQSSHPDRSQPAFLGKESNSGGRLYRLGLSSPHVRKYGYLWEKNGLKENVFGSGFDVESATSTPKTTATHVSKVHSLTATQRSRKHSRRGCALSVSVYETKSLTSLSSRSQSLFPYRYRPHLAALQKKAAQSSTDDVFYVLRTCHLCLNFFYCTTSGSLHESRARSKSVHADTIDFSHGVKPLQMCCLLGFEVSVIPRSKPESAEQLQPQTYGTH